MRLTAEILPNTTFKFQLVTTQIVNKETIYEQEGELYATRAEAMKEAKKVRGDWYVRVVGIVAESDGMMSARRDRIEASLGINVKPTSPFESLKNSAAAQKAWDAGR